MVSAALRADGLMTQANQKIVVFGIATAQSNAPRLDGLLAGSIQQIGAISAAGGEFGTSVIYAFIQEEGGTIVGNPLLFLQRNGVIFAVARQVTITGTHYMRRSVEEMVPFAMATWGQAIDQMWSAV